MKTRLVFSSIKCLYVVNVRKYSPTLNFASTQCSVFMPKRSITINCLVATNKEYSGDADTSLTNAKSLSSNFSLLTSIVQEWFIIFSSFIAYLKLLACCLFFTCCPGVVFFIHPSLL